jgi:ribosomal protein S27E
MAIVFELDKSGNPSPEITCDGCGGVITDHTHGVAILETPSAEEPEKVLKPIFLCTGCEEKTEKTAGPRRKMPIDQFLLRMANNVQLLPDDLEAAGRRMMKDSKYW